ncbi:MAG TPA: TRAP transporter small permease [Burkholderiales bacterium]|jgi:TRAP-type C4-dicarboxylate transport system permease small subunit
MDLSAAYRAAMEWLYIVCIVLSAAAMVVITIIIPYGVFMRYAMDSAASWPEPAGVLMTVLFSFIGGAAAYRANAHIAVGTLLNMVNAANRRRLEFVGDVGMGIIGVFMVKWGVQLVEKVWQNSIAEFPWLSTGVTYLPIPVAGVITLLFCVERLWLGQPPADSFTFRDQPQID